MKNRAWLRSIVNLRAREAEEHIRREIIELQEDTVIAALKILEREPGVLLADEVGMGKTFQTLAMIACLRDEKPKARILVVTPTRELSEQWYWTARRFHDHGFATMPESLLVVARSLRELPEACRKSPIVFVPVDIFVGARAKNELGFLLALWALHRKIPAKKLKAIQQQIRAGGLDLGSAQTFLGHSLKELARKPLAGAFKRSRGETREVRGLDDLLEDGIEAFAQASHVRRALNRARFHTVGTLLKPFDLLVVDEAHKFKDPWTVRAQAVTHVLTRNYHKAAFLTATPFQLGIEELRQVFRLFGSALSSPETFEQDVERLLTAVRSYQAAYERFEAVWRLVDIEQEQAFRAWSEKLAARPDQRPSLAGTDDPNVAVLADQAWHLLELKREQVEPAFRQWMLRSLKPNRRARRKIREWALRGKEAVIVPLTLFQRLQFEETRQSKLNGSTPADLSISSSFAAAMQSRLLTDRSLSARGDGYQQLVTRAIRTNTGVHPKVEAVVEEVLDATDAGEKTLIFCERNASIRELQERIEQGWLRRQHLQWNEVCPSYSFEQVFGGSVDGKRVQGIRERVPPRFYRGSDELSIALTESIPLALFSAAGTRSELPQSFWQATSRIIESANGILARCRVSPQSAVRVDYALASRCIDQAVVGWFLEREKNLSDLGPGDHALLEDIQDPRYPAEGSVHLRNAKANGVHERQKPQWSISQQLFYAVLAPRRTGIWIYYRDRLGALSPVVRHLAIEAVRYFLTRRDVPFLVDVMKQAGGPNASSTDLRNAIDLWWQQETCVWRQKVGELLDYLPCLTEPEQQAVLQDVLRSPRVVQNALDASMRILRKNTFNAPFYPMVLIGNQSIQQGLDLHRQCRRVVHYDLRWNPSDMEQRIGRTERHGCLAERFDADTPEGKVHVIYPLLEQSADPSLYNDIRLRERWMDFLLGQPPTALQVGGSTDSVQPLPASLVGELKVRLGPARCD